MNAPLPIALAPEELDSYRIRSRVEIVMFLREIAAQRCRLTAHAGAGASIATMLLAVNPEFEELVFDCSSDPVANAQLVRARALEFVTALDQIRIQFQTHGAEATIHDGLPALRVRLPDSLVRLQRREYFRVAAPVARPMLCALPDPADERKTLQLRVIDLSVGGLALLQPGTVAPYALGAQLEGCTLDLPESGRVVFNARVRSIAVHQRPQGTRVGCAFHRLPPHAHKLVQQQILAMERDRRSRT